MFSLGTMFLFVRTDTRWRQALYASLLLDLYLFFLQAFAQTFALARSIPCKYLAGFPFSETYIYFWIKCALAPQRALGSAPIGTNPDEAVELQQRLPGSTPTRSHQQRKSM